MTPYITYLIVGLITFIIGLIVGTNSRRKFQIVPDQLRAIAADKARQILKEAQNKAKIEDAVDSSKRALVVLEKSEELITLLS